MKEVTALELAKVMQSIDPGMVFGNTDYEDILESTTSQLMQLLIAVKEKKIQNSAFKDPEEMSTIRLLSSILEKINKRGENDKNFALPTAIQGFYLSQKLFVRCPLAFSFGNQEDLRKHEGELVHTVERWIGYLKSIYAKVNHTSRSFPEEKAFWVSLKSELDSIHNFAVSEEYEFVIEMLKQIGKLSLMYTLITLINDQRIYRLCDVFYSTYSNFEFSYTSFLKHNSGSPIVLDNKDARLSSSIVADYSHSPFVSNVLIIFRILRSLKKMPRVVRKSVSSNLNALRATIVQETFANFHPGFYEVYAEFSSLALHFNLQNDKDSGDSRITIARIKDFSKYIHLSNNIYRAFELFQYISSPGDKSQMLKLLKAFEFDLKKALFENEIQGNVLFPVSSVSPLDSGFVKELLRAKGDEFVRQQITSLSELRLHFKSHKVLFEFKTFESTVSGYVLNLLNTTINGSLANSLSSTADERSNRLMDIQNVVDVALTVLTLKNVLGHCPEVREFFDAKALRVKNITEAYEKFIADLPPDLLEIPIINAESSYDSDEMRINEDAVEVVEMEDQLTKLYETVISESSDLPVFDVKLLEDIKLIKPRLEGARRFLNEYRSEIRQCGSIFYSNEVEEYFQGLVGLKWKYYKEETQNQERRLYEEFKKKRRKFYKIFEELKNGYVLELINRRPLVGKEVDGQYDPVRLFDGFGRDQVEEALVRKKHEISEVVLRAVREKICGNKQVLDVVISKDSVQIVSGDVFNKSVAREYFFHLNSIEKLFNASDCIRQIEAEVQCELDKIKQTISEMAENHAQLRENENNKTSKAHVLSILEILQKTRKNEELYKQLSSLRFFDVNFEFDRYSFSDHIKSVSSQICSAVNQYKIDVRSSLLSVIQRHLPSSLPSSFIDSFVLHYRLLSQFGELHSVLSPLHEYIPNDTTIQRLQDVGAEDRIFTEFGSVSPPSPNISTWLNVVEDTLFDIVFGVNTEWLDAASIRSIIHKSLFFKPNPTLTQEEFESLNAKRCELASQISEANSIYHDFPCDENTFLPYLSQFKLRCDALSRDVEMFNKLFVFYKFDALSFDISTDVLESEYKVFRMLDQCIAQLMETKISEFIEQLGRGVFSCMTLEEALLSKLSRSSDIQLLSQRSFNTQLMKNFASKTEHLKFTLSYLKELSNLDISYVHFNLEGSLKDYIESFDEEQMSALIEKTKTDIEISKFLAEERPRIIDLVSVATAGLHSYVSNASELSSKLSAQRSMLELTLKFNKFGLYVKELEQVDDFIRREQECFDILCNVQDRILELGMVFSKESSGLLDLELTKYGRSKASFESLISGRPCSADVLSELKCIKADLNDIDNGINTMVDVLRHRCNRLYFVPNADLIRSMSSAKEACWLLTSIFNIGEVVTENGCIIGISSGTGERKESVRLISKVSLDDNLESIVNKFEVSLKQTLKSTFLNRICGSVQSGNSLFNQSISIIDELVCEYKYLTGRSKEKPYRVKRIEAYSEKFPDFMKILPRYTIAPENMSLDEHGQDVEDFSLKIDGLEYDFEYYPPTDFIFTYLTAKVFAAIILSKTESGVIFYGPSGTGKTESVKYYCRSIGKPLFVFCCNENCGFESLRNIIVGCELTGSYICFDEFNRLKKDVMSSITEMLYEKRGAVKVFLTMNLGYKGRSELPKTLKSIFGEMSVHAPDIKDIAYFYTGNYRMYNLINSLEKECSTESFYDFGLRAIKFIFDRAEHSDLCDGMHAGKTDDDAFLLNAICFYMAVLKNKDRQLLASKVQEVFSVKVRELGIDFSHESIFKRALCRRNGIVVFGKKGKSSLINKMTNPEPNSAGRIPKPVGNVFRYNPVNLLEINDSIFGSVNKTTKEWEDSIFLKDLRSTLHTLAETWFIFDGPLRAEWVEDFNSVFDDNRLLCLVTGERIKIPLCFKFIFETDSIEEATPATLTRLFMINADSIDNYKNSRCATYSDTNTANVNDGGAYGSLDEFQAKALSSVKKCLASDRVVFLVGNPGAGKKTIFKALTNASSNILYCNSLLDGKQLGSLRDREMVFLESFEKSGTKLKEQVREFWECGKIAGIRLPNLKIVCGINAEKVQFEDRLTRVKRVCIEGLGDVEGIIRKKVCEASNRHANEGGQDMHTGVTNAIVELLRFMYETFSPEIFNLSKVMLLIKLADFGLIFNSPRIVPSYLYFLCEITFLRSNGVGSNNAGTILRKFIQDTFNVKVSSLTFDANGSFSTEAGDGDQFTRYESYLSYLLYRKCSAVVKGPRLSGKRSLVRRCLEKINTNNSDIYRVLAWNECAKIRCLNGTLDPDLVYIFILLNESAGINEKFLGENAFEINLSGISTKLDLEKLIGGSTLSKSTYTSNDNKDSTSIDTYTNSSSTEMRFVSIEEAYDKHLEKYIPKKIVEFPNFFKLASFYYVFNLVRKVHGKEFEDRRVFLKKGIDRIEQFTRDANELRESIEKQKDALRVQQRRLEEYIALLSREREECGREQGDIRSRQDEINGEVALCEEKKVEIKSTLSGVEEILDESRRSILELNKTHLSEIKGMNNPPEIVRKTIECTYLLLEGALKVPEWGYLQGYLKRDDFIAKMLAFQDNGSMLDDSSGADRATLNKTMQNIKASLLEKYSLGKVENASKTCAMLYKWIFSVIKREEVLVEIAPLRNEVESIERRLAKAKDEMDLKIRELSSIVGRISEIEKSKEDSERESKCIKLNIEALGKKLDALESVLLGLEKESAEWKCIGFKNPLFIVDNPGILLEYFKVVYIDRNVLLSEDFSEFRKESIEVSMRDMHVRKGMSNAEYFNRNLIITDVDKYDPEVYDMLKRKMDRHWSYASACSSNGNVKTAGKPLFVSGGSVVIQGNAGNWFKEETFILDFKEKFKVLRKSNVEILEDALLKLLSNEHPDLKEILRQQALLEKERAMLKSEEMLQQVYRTLNECYWKINGRFVNEYGFQLSLNVFRTYVETKFELSSVGNTGKAIDVEDVHEFFGHSFGGSSMCRAPKSPYKVSEIGEYPFDYTFITNFNDVLFEVKSLLAFDVEISAGSPESNSVILGLLQEQLFKTILVKNIHFLPPAVKTGTNRFFYIIEPGERHNLMVESRIVYADRSRKYEVVCGSLANLFGSGNVVDYLVRHHSVGIALGLDLSLKDLEICIKNSEDGAKDGSSGEGNGAFSKEFLVEMVYYSKMAERERRLIEEEMKSKGFGP